MSVQLSHRSARHYHHELAPNLRLPDGAGAKSECERLERSDCSHESGQFGKYAHVQKTDWERCGCQFEGSRWRVSTGLFYFVWKLGCLEFDFEDTARWIKRVESSNWFWCYRAREIWNSQIAGTAEYSIKSKPFPKNEAVLLVLRIQQAKNAAIQNSLSLLKLYRP